MTGKKRYEVIQFQPRDWRGVVQLGHPLQPTRTALICPKGYGLCYTCSTWCDLPGSVQREGGGEIK